tara:strand:+ start:344 stop:556 length:213 start_codon:yes stop_codon:yes gene_type:complete
MGATLTWRPNKSSGSLSDELKRKLNIESDRIFDHSDIPYLKGLADCDIKDAQKLIELIEKYEEVALSLDY